METIAFFLVLGQESFRLGARTSQRVLPIGSQLQDFYYYHFGDFVNGFVIAYVVDGVADLVLASRKAQSSAQPRFPKAVITSQTLTICASLFSGMIVTAFELGVMPLKTTSDVYDIPAGLMGALVFCLIRLLALRISQPGRSVSL